MTHRRTRVARLRFDTRYLAFALLSPLMQAGAAHAAGPDDIPIAILPDLVRPALPDVRGRPFSLPPAAMPGPAVTRIGEEQGKDTSVMSQPLANTEIVVAQDLPMAPSALVPLAMAAPYGPADPAGAAPSDRPAPDPQQFRSLGAQLGAVKWEIAAMLGYYTIANSEKIFQNPTTPHFQKEGWFGKNTKNLGVDKVAHTYSAYVLAELIYGRLKRKTGDAPGIALTAAAIGSSVMLYTELWDSIERSGGWSWEDVAFNSMGAGFSVLRNSVPGLDKKLDFRLMIVPNSSIFSRQGKRHFEQQRYFFALKFAGFKAFEDSPARFLEFHAGYYGKDFTNEDRAAGVVPKRRIFVGVGINLRELFFKNAKSRVGRAAGEVLDYFQPPYTALHRHVTN